MAISTYLGNPPARVKQWIIDHIGPIGHSDTLYKYAGDTEWRTKIFGGTIALVNNRGESTGQIDNPTDIVAIEIGTGTQANPVTSIGNHAFWYCKSLTSVTIPNSVTSIGNAAFSGCSGLTSVTIPDSVTSIGNQAFYGCWRLTGVTIPDGVTRIGSYTFTGCSRLTSVTIPNSVTSIGSEVFIGCRSLTTVTIPDSVTSIGDSAFYGCNNLSEMSMLGFSCDYIKANAYYWRIAVPAKQLVTIQCSDGYVILNDKSQSSDGKGNLNGKVLFKTSVDGEWQEEDADIIDGVFKGFFSKSSAVEVIIPSKDVNGNSVTHIGEYAFVNCKGLTNVLIGNNIRSIGQHAFYECRGLTSVTIPDRVTSIGDYSFYNCSGLMSVTIPNSVTSIGEGVFWGCSGLTSVTIPNSVTSIGNWTFAYCHSLTIMTIPNSVTSIGRQAFFNCNGLTSVTIPNSVTSIGLYAFYNTPFYNNQPDGLIVLGSIAYAIKGNYPSFMIIPPGVTRIGREAFAHCWGLTSVTIPNSVTNIGYNAFTYCNNLSEMSMPNFSCNIVKARALTWGIAVPAKQLVTI